MKVRKPVEILKVSSPGTVLSVKNLILFQFLKDLFRFSKKKAMVLCSHLFIYSTVQCIFLLFTVHLQKSSLLLGAGGPLLVWCVVPMESSLCYEFQDVYLGPGLQGHRTQGHTGTEAPHWGTI